MDPDFGQLMEKARKVRLSEKDKAKVRQNLIAYMKLHPPRQSPEKDQDWRLGLKAFWQIISAHPTFAGSFAVIFFILVTGAVAARGTLPGNFLYPVKVSVLEAIPQIFNRTDAARAKWELLLAERRLAEAEELASNGLLNPETADTIGQSMQNHAARIEAWAAKAGEQKQELIAVNDALIRIGALTNEKTLAQLKIQSAKADVDIDKAAEDAKTEAAVKLTRVEKAFAEGAFSASERLRVQTYIRVAAGVIDAGKARDKLQDSRGALVLFKEGLILLEKAEELINGKS